MPTLTSIPALPIPGKPLKLRVNRTESGSNYVKLWLTDAPVASRHKVELVNAGANRSIVFEGQGGANNEATFEPDIGGAYHFVAQEYTKGAATFGGGYQFDPDSFQTETAVGAEAPVVLYVGQRMTAPVGAGDHTATVVVYAFNESIRSTSVEVQGEKTPDVINPTSAASRIARGYSGVVNQLPLLDDNTVSLIVNSPTLYAVADELLTDFNLHRVQASVHAANDTDNVIDTSFRVPATPAGLIATVNEIRLRFDLHMRNAKGTDTATGSQGYHAPSGNKRADLANMILAPPAGDIATAVLLLADMYDAYEKHRQSTVYHSAADNTNNLTTVNTYLQLHRYFFDSLRQNTVSTPAGEQTGAILLAKLAGFKDEPK